MSFRVNALPICDTLAPGDLGFAYIHNLADLSVWTSGGSHAKPRLTFRYTDTEGHAMTHYTVEVEKVSDSSTVWKPGQIALSATAGSTVTLSCPNAVIAGTEYRWRVKARDALGEEGAFTSWMRFKVKWTQAIYSHNAGTASSAWQANLGSVTGGQVATIFQGANDAAGTGGTAWSASIAAGQGKAYSRICVRLATMVVGQNTTLSDLYFGYVGAAQVPDNWQMVGSGSVEIDPSMRRFGERAVKLTATAASSVYLAPYRTAAGDGISVLPSTRYTYSAFVRTPATLGTGKVRLRVLRQDGSANLVTFTTESSDTSAGPDGWERLQATVDIPEGVTACRPIVEVVAGSGALYAWVDGVQFEPGTVATSYHSGSMGRAAVADNIGLVVDGQYGGVFRLRGGHTTHPNTEVALGELGLIFGSPLTVKEIGVPTINPPSGYRRLYFKSGGGLYMLDSAGVETLLTSGGGGGVTDHGALTGLLDDDHPQYATDSDLTTHAATPHGGGSHPDLATHDSLGLTTDTELTAALTAHEAASNPHSTYATDADLTAHAATSHGTAHPNLATHDALGLATDTEVTSAIATHAATPHGGGGGTDGDDLIYVGTTTGTFDLVRMGA